MNGRYATILLFVICFSIGITANTNRNPLCAFPINPNEWKMGLDLHLSLPVSDPTALSTQINTTAPVFCDACSHSLVFINVEGFDRHYIYFADPSDVVLTELEKFKTKNLKKFWIETMSFDVRNIDSVKKAMNDTIYRHRCSKTAHNEFYFSGNDAITEFKGKEKEIFERPSTSTGGLITTAYVEIKLSDLKKLLGYISTLSSTPGSTASSSPPLGVAFIFSTHESQTVQAQADEPSWITNSSTAHFFELYSIAGPSTWMLLVWVLLLLVFIVFGILFLSRIQVPEQGFKKD